MVDQKLEDWLALFPEDAGLTFRLHPTSLYTVADLYDTYEPDGHHPWEGTYDHLNYEWFVDATSGRPRTLSIGEAVAARVHDAGIERAIDEFLRSSGSKAVGFMGGHSVSRLAVPYRQVAAIARDLRRAGSMVVTGGGPGLMEAANLGAFLAPYADAELDAALQELSVAPESAGKAAGDWIRSAALLRARLLDGNWRATPRAGSENLGVPTWLYGHEPPNLFATAVGKYFYNSVREDGLVNLASGGIIFGTGEAGTVQEVFQDVTVNYYTAGKVKPTPMVFFGKAFWDPGSSDASPLPDGSQPRPVYPLVKSLARTGHPSFERSVMISDEPTEIVAFLRRVDPTLQTDGSQPMTFAEARLASRHG